MDFKGKKALVTGGSRGIGLAIATALSKEGAEVTIIGRNPANLLKAREALPALKTLQLDLGNWAEVQQALSGLPFDILVNNAAIYNPDSFMEATEQNFNDTFDNNLKSVFCVSQAVVKSMSAGGVILNVSSVVSRCYMPFTTTYSCAKAGLDHLTKVMANELAPLNIRVVGINPGGVETDMIAESSKVIAGKGVDLAELYGPVMKRFLLNGDGEKPGVIDMDRLVGTVLFLLSEKAGSITGQSILVDNGYSAS